MNEISNPYESPASTGLPAQPISAWPSPLILFAKGAFWVGLGHAVIGFITSFYPGASCGWFLASAALIAAGVFVRQRAYRGVAILACATCLFFAYSGYQDGIEYRKWQEQATGFEGLLGEGFDQ